MDQTEAIHNVMLLLIVPYTYLADGKVIHLIKGINSIFKSKGNISSKQIKAQEIFHVIEVQYYGFMHVYAFSLLS